MSTATEPSSAWTTTTATATTTTSSSFRDTTALTEDPLSTTHTPSGSEGSNVASHANEQSGSAFEYHEAETLPLTAAPTVESTTIVPTEAPSPTPNATLILKASTKSGASGGAGAAVSATLVVVGLLIVLGIVLLIRRRRRNNRFIEAKFQHDPNLGTPKMSIELPPPPPSARLSYDPLSQSQQQHQQRLSVFSNGRGNNLGASIFNTSAAAVSPKGGRRQQQSSHAASAFRPDQSTTYRLLDPTPSNNLATPILQSNQPSTPVLQATPPSRPQYEPDYDHYTPQYEASTSADRSSTKIRTTSLLGDRFSARLKNTLADKSSAKLKNAAAAPSTFQTQINNTGSGARVSVASTIQGFHDSMCEDLYQYGDGLQRERTESRESSRMDRARSRSRGQSSASAIGDGLSRKPTVVLEIDDLIALPPSRPPSYTTPKASKKTFSLAEMTGKSRVPPPPVPTSTLTSSASSTSFFIIPPSSPSLSEDQFGSSTSMMNSVRYHEARASEDIAGNHVTAHTMTTTFASSASSTTSAAASAGSASSFGSDSSMLSDLTVSSSSINLHSSHNGRIFEKPTDTAIQRLSDVSSVSSEMSNFRAGSLIELKQVVEVDNDDGKAKEIEI